MRMFDIGVDDKGCVISILIKPGIQLIVIITARVTLYGDVWESFDFIALTN